MKKYSIFDGMPPEIDYEELARQAGYSEEAIHEMFGDPIECIFFDNKEDTKDDDEVDCNQLNLSTPLDSIPF